VAFCRLKKNKLLLIKSIDRSTGRTVAWVLGNRDTATFQRLYYNVKHLTGCTFYTDKLTLNTTIATRGIIWGGLRDEQRLFRGKSSWSI
jgi:IS1 family transposase